MKPPPQVGIVHATPTGISVVMTTMSIAALIVMAAVGQSVDVPVFWSGSGSKVTTPEIALAADEWQWMRTWMRHTGATKELEIWEKVVKERPEEARYDYYNESGVPSVNFKTHVVLVIFSGRVRQTAGYSLLGTFRTGDAVTVRYAPDYYSVVVPYRKDSSGLFVDVPFLFVLLPRDFRTLRLEKGITEGKGKPITKFQFVKELRL